MPALQITEAEDSLGRAVLTVRGEVDLATAPQLRAAVMDRLSRCRGLVLDVSGAVLFDASGLRVLTAAHREAAALGKGPIVLRGVRPMLAKTLRITGLDHLFPREPAPVPTLARIGYTSRPIHTPRPARRDHLRPGTTTGHSPDSVGRVAVAGQCA